MNQEIVGLIVFVVLSVSAWWLFFVEQQNYWLDLTRQRLFEIRDKLFDTAAEGKIAFDHPAYMMTRDTLNGMITFTHQVNLLHLTAIYLSHKFLYKGRRSTDYEKRFTAAIKDLSLENKRIILSSIAMAHLTMLRHIMSTSFILWPILKPLSLVFAALRFTKKIRRKTLRGNKRKQPWPVLDAEANYIGEHVGTPNNHTAVLT